MRSTTTSAATAILMAASAAAILAAGTARGSAERDHAAPPPVSAEQAPPEILVGGLRAATTQYSHGDPSDDEQWFLELMNRARANPQAEADRVLVDYGSARVKQAVDFFLRERPGVEWSRNENHDAFDALPVVPPFAFVPELIDAARGHTRVMKQTDSQTHQATGEPPLRDRVTATGYGWSRLGESVFAFADDMLHAHAGFAIDWGQPLDGGTGRPQTGHRNALMDPFFATVGVGVEYDRSGATRVGPQLITIDFAVPADTATRYVTGVVYEDRNANGMYDPGEGIEGVRIETDRSDFFALSSASGGYAIPVAANAGQTVVSARGEPGTAGELVGEQQVVVTLAGANVKVDFGPPPEPAPPPFTTVAGAAGVAIGDGTVTQSSALLPELDPDFPTVGDVNVAVSIAHADRGELRLTLVGPTGVEVVLFDGAPGGTDLRGEFDTTLRAHESLAALIGTPHQGTWTLRIQDAAGGVVDGVLESWTLHVRPGWVRPLFAEPSPLVLKTLKVKDSAKAGKDKVIVKADLDAGGVPLDPALGGTLRLLDAGTGAEFLEVDLDAPAAKAATPEGAAVKARVALDAATSRGSVVMKVTGLDLDGPAPATTRVELALGGAILAQDVTVESGRSGASQSPVFFVDAVKSKLLATGGRSTVVKGRLSHPDGIDAVTGVVEVAVGSARHRIDAGDLAVKGSKRVFKSGAGLRKLVVDLARGTFVLKVDGAHDVRVGDVVPVSLRLGNAFYGSTEVLPFDKGTKTLY